MIILILMCIGNNVNIKKKTIFDTGILVSVC